MMGFSTIALRIGYQLKKGEFSVLDDLNLDFPESSLICLLGVNGSGKSTLLRTLAGFQKPLAGDINIDGSNMARMDPKSKAKLLSIVLTNNEISGKITVREVVALGRYPYTNWLATLGNADEEKIEKALELAGLLDLSQKYYDELSDGQKQKTILARAIAQDTPTILLDEPTNHLDIGNKAEMFQLLKILAHDENKTILLSTHDINLACQLADQLWVIGEGRLLQGSPEQLVLDGALEKAFPYEGIDLIHGRLERTTRGNVSISGPDRLVSVTELALLRLGFIVEASAAIRVTVKNNPDNEWSVTYQDKNMTFGNIDDLIKYFRSEIH